ncbi:hypothetical protein [Marivirga sp.]|uniref:hypothetical protein n=1 Tax=Marivirga sp. TaxID=2018662 RepID=UPI0025F78B60|nr:hypothetical protein [Marivirga sp.]
MKKLSSLFFILLIIACDSSKSYNSEEEKAIEGVINSFITHYIEKKNRIPRHSKIDSALMQRGFKPEEIKVYISDALLPISQIFEDNKWMNSKVYQNEGLNAQFSDLYNSKTFYQLEYREFTKGKINLNTPLKQCYNCTDKITADEQYSMISFSRICFNEEKNMGLVVIHYGVGFEASSMSGHHGPFLIKKQNDSWSIIPK